MDSVAFEEQRQQEFSLAILTLKRLESAVDSGDDEATAEWLEVATYLVDAFRETKQLFPSDSNKKFTGVLSRKWKRKGAAEHDIETQADEMASRLERTMSRPPVPSVGPQTLANESRPLPDEPEEEPVLAVDSFRGITFDDWLGLIIKVRSLPCLFLFRPTHRLACLVVLICPHQERRDRGWARDPRACSRRKRLQAVSEPNVLPVARPCWCVRLASRNSSSSDSLALAACYAFVQNYTEVVNVVRAIQRRHQFQTEGLRLLLALLPHGAGAIEAFNGSTLQKFMMRQLMSIDRIARGTETRIGRNGFIVLVGEKAEKDDEPDDADGTEEGTSSKFIPTKSNPLYTLSYGHMLVTSKSYQSAISALSYPVAPVFSSRTLTSRFTIVYLLRAYELAPKQPLINLSLGIAYLHRAMSRQTDNRQHQLTQVSFRSRV